MREAPETACGEADPAASDIACATAGALAFADELAPLLLPAFRLAVGLLLDPALAEDAVQEASLRAWDRRSQRRAGTELRPWFFAIVANRCRDTRRSRWARVLLSESPPEPAAPAPDDYASGIDVRRALSALPRKDRLAIVLRYYLDLPYAEIADLLGCSVNAARLRVSRTAAVMRRMLAPTEEQR